ncbi:MAG: type II toxin-antitoxin system Phd/YefM family antitoxin [Pyrinomonadaceae bacterium]
MTKTISVNDVSLQTIIALTKNGDEIVLEENGKPPAKVTPIEKPKGQKKLITDLGKGTMFVSEDFDEEISLWETASDEDFLNFEKQLTGEK